MDYLVKAVCFLAAFVGMEFVAWFTHKYIMHGFLWVLHKDHHEPGYRAFERNDWFGVFFAAISIVFTVLGASNGFDYRFFIGIGIAAYGAAYFFVHDIYVHRRVKWFDGIDNRYLRALRIAHKIHHKKMGKEHGESFGFLLPHPKYFNNQSNKN